MANKRVLSIEIGSKLTRIVEVDHKVKNPKIYKKLLLETPKGVMNDGTLNVTEEFVRLLKTKISQSGIKSKQVIFTVTSTKIASREILIPKVKENRIGALVEANASDYFPVDLSQYELAYYVLDTVRESVDTEKYKVMVMAMAKTMLDSYEKLAKECGYTAIALDYSGNSLYQIVKKKCADGISMVVKINGSSSMVTIIENGTMLMQRTVSDGIDGIVSCCQKETGKETSYIEALKLLGEKNLLEIPPEDTPDTERKQRYESYDEAFSDTGLGISRIYDYHNSRNAQKPITKVYLTGIGAKVRGLELMLAQRLGAEVEILDTAEDFVFDAKCSKEDICFYISNLGATLAPLGFLDARKEEIKNGEVKNINNGVFVFFIACGVISLFLLLAGLIPFILERKEKEGNAARVEELSDVISVYQEYVQTKNADSYLRNAYEYTELPTEQLVEFLEEMEAKLPKDSYITSFSANREGVSFMVTVKTKQQAAEALLQLRTFESLTNVRIDSLSDTRGEDSAGVVMFSVAADYVNGKEQQEEMTGDAADTIIQEYEDDFESGEVQGE